MTEPKFNLPPKRQMPEDEIEFRDWLTSHRAHFLTGHYSSGEISELAIACGFDRTIICRVLSHFKEAVNGISTDNEFAMQLFLFEFGVYRADKLQNPEEPGCIALWQDLAFEQTGENIHGNP